LSYPTANKAKNPYLQQKQYTTVLISNKNSPFQQPEIATIFRTNNKQNLINLPTYILLEFLSNFFQI